MIQIATDLKTLETQVDALVPKWRSRAKTRTTRFIKQKAYKEKSSIWSEIKAVFMKLQHNKCAYCERELAAPPLGSGEHDLEHFRPKGRIEPYPTADAGVMYSFQTGNSQANGYYWLAYNLENYAVACITCNRGLKADRFPIAGTRGAAETSVSDLNQIELPLLLFPLLDNPEEFITFDGAMPKTVFKRGIKYQRAVVTINFFGLGDTQREELFRGRFAVIRELYLQYEKIKLPSETAHTKELAQIVVDGLCDQKSGHSACAKAYHILLQNDPMRAWKIYETAAMYQPRS